MNLFISFHFLLLIHDIRLKQDIFMEKHDFHASLVKSMQKKLFHILYKSNQFFQDLHEEETACMFHLFHCLPQYSQHVSITGKGQCDRTKTKGSKISEKYTEWRLQNKTLKRAHMFGPLSFKIQWNVMVSQAAETRVLCFPKPAGLSGAQHCRVEKPPP